MIERTILAFALYAIASSPCAATLTYATAGELRDDCALIPRMLRGEQAALSAAGECIAFIDGARGVAQVVESERASAALCIPEAATSVDLAAVFVRAVDRQPERRSESAARALYFVLAVNFPCRAERLP
ncbi:MAG TPA: Rap1a/Tai family immunity protein [Casimicrobiaceae bacterium]|nr:Rap1a/Tai family immunity protein [Casimicrobiaceae bacterium]